MVKKKDMSVSAREKMLEWRKILYSWRRSKVLLVVTKQGHISVPRAGRNILLDVIVTYNTTKALPVPSKIKTINMN